MFNKKGFTLIELLAVIVIISILLTLVSLSVTKRVKKVKDDLHTTQINSILSAAEVWVIDNIESLHTGCTVVTLGELQNLGLISDTIEDPSTKAPIAADTKIKIIITGTSGNLKFSYEYAPTDVSGCY